MWLPDLWKLVDRWIERAHRGDDHERAISRAERYVRIRPRDEHGWMLWAQMLDHADRLEDAIQALREGHTRLSEPVEIGSLLAFLLLPKDATGAASGDKLEESGEILKTLIQNHPSAPRPYFVLTQRAVAMEAWEDASRYASLCMDRLDPNEETSFLLGLGKLMTLIPDEEDRGFDLVARAAEAGDPEASLIMGVLLEPHDPRRAASFMKYSKRRWKSDNRSWEKTVESARKQWRQNDDPPSN